MKQKQSNLSIIILCHQKNKQLIQAVESSVWANEVLLIQTNPEISLCELEEQYGVTVHIMPPITDFSAIRNEAMDLASSEWIFFLDSDEWITEDLQQEISSRLKEQIGEVFAVPRRDVFLGKELFHGEVQGVKIIRLLKKGSGRWHDRAHEKYVPHGQVVQHLRSPLFHQPHPSISAFIKKVNFYATLLAEEKTEHKLIARSIVFPIGKFLYTFLFKMGFLDGYRGFIYSFLMSLHSSLVRIKRLERSLTL